jgi:hypothetical protein
MRYNQGLFMVAVVVMVVSKVVIVVVIMVVIVVTIMIGSRQSIEGVMVIGRVSSAYGIV